MNIDRQSHSSTHDLQATEDLQAGVIRAIYASRERSHGGSEEEVEEADGGHREPAPAKPSAQRKI